MSKEFKRLELVEGDVKIELEHIGEGFCGDFNKDDPDDSPLMRFWAYQLEDGEWDEVENSSYCCQLPATAPKKLLEKALALIVKIYAPAIRSGKNIKSTGEKLSWLSLDDISE